MRKIYLLILNSLYAPIATAQLVGQGSYQYDDETQLWRQTQNAAGLSLDSAANRGIAFFDYAHWSGDFHRTQEGGQNNNLGFFTERYQKIGRYLYGYGSFKFDMGRTKERSWSDVLRSYNSNPFISGSSVNGKYDNQDFEMKAALSSVQLGQFTYGGSLLYKAGDLSRLRDPRSRINLAEYRFTPAVTWSAGSTTLGLAAHYDRRKEKLPGLTTVQTDPNLMYYVMTGLENATGTIGGYNGYMREYVNHELGAELTYGYRSAAFSSVTSLAIDHGTEYVYGTNKYEPGRYFNYKYALSSRNRLHTGRLLHAADLTIGYEEAYADEYRQERISETDSVTGFNSIRWNTIIRYDKRYQLKKLDASLHYRLSVVSDNTTLGYAGVLVTLQDVSNKRLLNTSEMKYASASAKMEGGLSLGKGLWAEATAGYHVSTKADLLLADPTTAYAEQVLLPDMTILDANYLQGSVKLTYQLPIAIEQKTSNWFVSLYGDYLSAQGDLKRYQAGCTIGLYY